ncbi:hypothetical protein ISF_06402 [Cordyceps fumosorosea ARSEF 2679]|uniref:RNA helicase HEL117 n=1 Tax=Cordyceps fumosorosea (strain ARSEF 2679) TaxID=1081104 RepID=A0A167SBX9_CORFA|nr:hypothetical protein ISF_06402 [Cordyceps fumosorosea ARSEF 2679]OAA59467.1 hypothetical protein ISF_06402 [Cordyceps fumosorosea ARSEF 2679]
MSGVYDEHSSRATRQTDDSRRHRDDRRSRSPGRAPRRRSRDAGHERKRTTERRRQEDDASTSRRHRSPHRHHHRRKERDSPAVVAQPPATLPFDARALTKGDLRKFEPLLAHYLDLQKQKYMDDMDDREVRGRWKSFMGKWNRGELAEGWYDPAMFQRILESYAQDDLDAPTGRPEPDRGGGRYSRAEEHQQHSDLDADDADDAGDADADADDSDYGPALPAASSRRGKRIGVGIPSKDDLALRDETRAEDREAARQDLRADRRADRKLQKERLDELAPRAEAGTRERQLEKKREVGDKMRQFREGGSPGPMAAANEAELMGGGDALAEYKQRKVEEQRRKSEREVRREELQRAKEEEMEERRRRWQEREEGTMSMLQELARQRFGPGS